MINSVNLHSNSSAIFNGRNQKTPGFGNNELIEGLSRLAADGLKPLAEAQQELARAEQKKAEAAEKQAEAMRQQALATAMQIIPGLSEQKVFSADPPDPTNSSRIRKLVKKCFSELGIDPSFDEADKIPKQRNKM